MIIYIDYMIINMNDKNNLDFKTICGWSWEKKKFESDKVSSWHWWLDQRKAYF